MVALLCQDMTVSRGEYHIEIKPEPGDVAGELQAVHAGHDHVGENEIKFLTRSVQQLQRSLTVLNPSDDLSQSFQPATGEFTDGLVILDKGPNSISSLISERCADSGSLRIGEAEA